MWPSAYSSGTPKLTWKSRNDWIRRRLGLSSREDVAEPRDVDEGLSWFGSAARAAASSSAAQPGAPAVEDRAPSRLRVPERGGEPVGVGRPVAVDDHVASGGDPLGIEQSPDLGAIDRLAARRPGTRPRPGCGRRAPRRSAASRCRPPAAGYRRWWAWVGESIAESAGGDAWSSVGSSGRGDGGKQGNPCRCRGCGDGPACGISWAHA